jgi:hypothetical protein
LAPEVYRSASDYKGITAMSNWWTFAAEKMKMGGRRCMGRKKEEIMLVGCITCVEESPV